MPKTRNKQKDPALDLLYELRTESYQNSVNKILIAAAQVQLNECDNTPWHHPVMDILAWLAAQGAADTTLHNKLDQIIPFLEIVGAVNLRTVMESKEPEDFLPEGKTLEANLTSYFATLKSLWAHLTNNAPEPKSLCYTGTEKLAPHPIMTPLELDTLIDHAANYFDSPIGYTTLTEADDAIAFLLLTSHCRLRYTEASENLRLGHVWLVNRTLTVIVTTAKGGKSRQETSSLLLPHWAANYLRWYIELRLEQTKRDPHALFYGGGLITDNSDGYHRLYQFFRVVKFWGGLHELRRYGGNLGRVRGESLLDCINHFGQTTSTTGPRNYLSSLCLVQWQRLYDWVDQQKQITFPTFSIREFASTQDISREHARRLVLAAAIKRLPRQKLSLSMATQTLKMRIQMTQYRESPNAS